MNCTEFHELAALAVVDDLDPAGKARLEAWTAADEDARAEVARLRDAAAALMMAYSSPQAPSSALRSRILDKIRNAPRTSPPGDAKPAMAAPPSGPMAPEGFSFTHQHDRAWAETAIPGLKVKILSVNNREGYRVVLAQLSPGARFPRHIHKSGPEELFVVSGDLETEGRTLRAGDFLHAESGTDHGELYSLHGCIALLVEPVGGPEIPMVV